MCGEPKELAHTHIHTHGEKSVTDFHLIIGWSEFMLWLLWMLNTPKLFFCMWYKWRSTWNIHIYYNVYFFRLSRSGWLFKYSLWTDSYCFPEKFCELKTTMTTKAHRLREIKSTWRLHTSIFFFSFLSKWHCVLQFKINNKFNFIHHFFHHCIFIFFGLLPFFIFNIKINFHSVCICRYVSKWTNHPETFQTHQFSLNFMENIQLNRPIEFCCGFFAKCIINGTIKCTREKESIKNMPNAGMEHRKAMPKWEKEREIFAKLFHIFG